MIANAGDGYNLKEIGELKVMEAFFTDESVTIQQLQDRNNFLAKPEPFCNGAKKQIIQVIDEIYRIEQEKNEENK